MEKIHRFIERFKRLAGTDHKEGFAPYPWQIKLFERMVDSDLPDALDIPTGLGKTSVMLVWLLARLEKPSLPRRLVYVVDRRAVVDQATDEATRLSQRLAQEPEICAALGIEGTLPVSTLRGQFTDNRRWSENPAHPAIVVSTVDMTGSRLGFQGYRLSKKQWPIHAGLLAYDSLIVLDEAHLNEPFRGFLDDLRGLVRDLPGAPASRVMSLSATGRQTGMGLDDADLEHPRVKALLRAPKPLTIKAAEGKLPEQLAEDAWRLATPEDGPVRRVLVFCNSRESAGKAAELLRKKLAEYGKAEKKDYTTTHLNLLVGERRVHERQELGETDLYKRFLGRPVGDDFSSVPAFLVATSAGEVGIDLDAQAMACDLVPWERMVQRLGRVNRRGSTDAAPITVIDTPDDKNPKRYQACLSLLRALPENEDGTFDARVGALRGLRDKPDVIERASTRPPLRPKLSLPVAEGWALTSLQEEHTGNPDITPWLRGWVEDDDPQCEVFWRAFIPWRKDEDRPDVKVIADWFDAAPPHQGEMLEAPVWRVLEVLKKQFKSAPVVHEALQKRCVLLLDKRGKLLNQWTHTAFAELLDDSRKLGRFKSDLAGKRLLLQADIGGLGEHGLLTETDEPVLTLDGEKNPQLTSDQGECARKWAEQLGLQFALINSNDENTEKDAKKPEGPLKKARRLAEFTFSMARLDDEKAAILSVKRLPDKDDANENTAISRNEQTLKEHQQWVEAMAADMAHRLNLSADLTDMLRIVAAHHDDGKAHPVWQASVGAPKDVILAKTTGAGAKKIANGYRHELGSLLDPALAEALAHLPDDLRELGYHLVVSHHGHARPYINSSMPLAPADSPFGLSPPEMKMKVLDTALRFARVQKHWGPWGLAWWEAVLRAADARASYWNDRPDGRPEFLKREERGTAL